MSPGVKLKSATQMGQLTLTLALSECTGVVESYFNSGGGGLGVRLGCATSLMGWTPKLGRHETSHG